MALYEDFLKTLEAHQEFLQQEKQVLPRMTHEPSDITIVRRLFEGYLAEEELSLYQFCGRYWDIIRDKSSANGYTLIIILDNETVLRVSQSSSSNGEFVEGIYKVDDARCFLPNKILH